MKRDTEIDAMKVVYETMRHLDEPEQKRISAYVWSRLQSERKAKETKASTRETGGKV